MSKSILVLFVIFFLFLLLSGGTLTSSSQYGNVKVITELKIKLGLDEVQVVRVEAILSANKSQKDVDINLFKMSSMALIRAAERRLNIIDGRISDILRGNQKISFNSYKKERKMNRELFRLREGLLLDRKQEIQIELIISEYRSILKKLYDRLDYYVKSGQDMRRKNSKGERLLKSRTGGLERRTPGVKKMEQGPSERILNVQKEKAKRITKYLTLKQKVLYSEILRFQKQELRLHMRKLRK